MVAADKLYLQELVDYLQEYLIENKSEWIEQHFELTYRTNFQSNSLLKLQKFCTDLMTKTPEKVFKSLDFTLLPEKSFVSLLKQNSTRAIVPAQLARHQRVWAIRGAFDAPNSR